jgi:hypothetical protein
MKLRHVLSLLGFILLAGCASAQIRLKQEDIAKLDLEWHPPILACEYAQVIYRNSCYIPLNATVSTSTITTVDERFFKAKEICFDKLKGEDFIAVYVNNDSMQKNNVRPAAKEILFFCVKDEKFDQREYIINYNKYIQFSNDRI